MVSKHGDDERAGFPEAGAAYFYSVPLTKLLLLGFAGGGIYQMYWMYRCWRAYRDHDGYSRAQFWRRVRKRTGYRPSPVWRALLCNSYCVALFPAVHRECVSNGAKGLRFPVPLALAYGALGAPMLLGSWHFAALAAALLLPVQAAINRLNSEFQHKPRWALTGGEILALLVGAFVYWRQ